MTDPLGRTFFFVPFDTGSSWEVGLTLAFRRTPEQGADELDDPHESPWWPLLDVGEIAEQQVGEILLVAL